MDFSQMDEDIKAVSLHMSAFSEEILEEALRLFVRCLRPHSFVGETTPNRFTAALTLSGVAHGTELLMKSAIAAEHPLLLFSDRDLRRRMPETGPLSMEYLMEGHTVQLADLPGLLWRATGYRIEDVQEFDRFRALRNRIEHFTVPSNDLLLEEVGRFLVAVVDPMLKKFWSTDLLSLLRPRGVGALLQYCQDHKIALAEPDWLMSADLEEEERQLDELDAFYARHLEWTEANQTRLTSWFLRMLVVVPVESQIMANREMIRITGEVAEMRTFERPVSPTGAPPPTHFMAHTSATREIAERIIRLTHRRGGWYRYTSVSAMAPFGAEDKAWQSLLSDAGLTVVQEMSES